MQTSPATAVEKAAITGRPLVAALYIRVSTGRQEQEETIEVQLDQIKTAIENDGNVLPAENIFADDGWTGELLPRPRLDAMREAAMLDRFEILYVYDLGRISRIQAYQVIVLEELEAREISFKSLHDPPAVTEEEKVMQGMRGLFHQYERVKIAERFRMAKLFRAKQGVLINGQLPYGYTRISRTDTDPARALVNEDHADVVRKIRIWFGSENLSVYGIIQRLHKLRTPPPRGKSESWRKSTIERLLRSEVYHTGRVFFNKTEAIVARKPRDPDKYRRVKRTSRRIRPREDWLPLKIPVIVPDDGLYERIRQILADRAHYGPRNRKYGYLLSGKVMCACGSRRVGDGYGRNHYYRCAERVYKFPIKGECRASGVNAPALDEAVWNGLREILQEPEQLLRQAARWIEHKAKHTDGGIAEIARSKELLASINTEEERYVKAYGAGAIGFEQFRKVMNGVKRRKAKAQSDLQNSTLQGDAKATPLPTQSTLSKAAEVVLQSLPTAGKAKLIKDLIAKVVIGSDNMTEVWAHLPVVALNVGDKHAYGQSHAAIPHLEFKFNVPIPSPRKNRLISKRDANGRIIQSAVADP